jgi:hypothetical protein
MAMELVLADVIGHLTEKAVLVELAQHASLRGQEVFADTAELAALLLELCAALARDRATLLLTGLQDGGDFLLAVGRLARMPRHPGHPFVIGPGAVRGQPHALVQGLGLGASADDFQ